MLYVLYSNSGVHSGRALRQALSEMYKKRVSGGFPKRFAQVCRKEGVPEAIINLGVTDEIGFEGLVLNTQEMVRAASNKRKARVLFEGANVPAPRLFTSATAVTQECLPVIARTSYHCKGEGFWFCKTLQDVQKAVRAGATHFLEFVGNTREYRVHTFIKGKHLKAERKNRTHEAYISTKISEKVWQGEGKPSADEPQKNHEFGWTFLGPQDRRPDELDVVRHAAKQAIAALGMDFGAVDVMYSIRNKLPYVLEVNSTPSLADAQADTCETYAKRILKTLGGKEDDE
jgi:hypothetical protein